MSPKNAREIEQGGGSLRLYQDLLARMGTDWVQLKAADDIHYAQQMADRGECEEHVEILRRQSGHPYGCRIWFRRPHAR